jgi:hypothetical protein
LTTPIHTRKLDGFSVLKENSLPFGNLDIRVIYPYQGLAFVSLGSDGGGIEVGINTGVERFGR